jgi:LDH2 family malate/lactate/ureidoglycolate dehydrogenase
MNAAPPEAGLSALGADPYLASHKGYGLAVAVQILAGTLSGGPRRGDRRPARNAAGRSRPAGPRRR